MSDFPAAGAVLAIWRAFQQTGIRRDSRLPPENSSSNYGKRRVGKGFYDTARYRVSLRLPLVFLLDGREPLLLEPLPPFEARFLKLKRMAVPSKSNSSRSRLTRYLRYCSSGSLSVRAAKMTINGGATEAWVA